MPIFFALYQVIIKIPGYIGGIKDVFASAVSHITDVSGYSDIIFQFVKDNAIKNSYIPMSGKLSSDHVVDFLYSLSPAQWDKLADVDKFQGFADVNSVRMVYTALSVDFCSSFNSCIGMGYTGFEYEACSDSI